MFHCRTPVVYLLTVLILVLTAGANPIPFLHLSGYRHKVETAALAISRDSFAAITMYNSALARTDATPTAVFFPYQDYMPTYIDGTTVAQRKGVLDWLLSILGKLVLPNRNPHGKKVR